MQISKLRALYDIKAWNNNIKTLYGISIFSLYTTKEILSFVNVY